MREALARRLDRRNPAQAVIQILIDVVLHAGRGAVELALYTLLPIMVVMMILLRPWGSCISSSLTGSLQRKRSPHGLAGISGHSQCRHVERCGPFARNKPLQQRRRHFSKGAIDRFPAQDLGRAVQQRLKGRGALLTAP
jgi:hypothetical protein